MNKKELPIGTVVMLVGGSKKVMITGYRSKNADADKVFDYNGCVFPEGLMENIYCLFDASQIEDVIYMGLESKDENDYLDKVSSNNSFSSSSMRDDSLTIPKTDDGITHHRTPKAPTNPMSKSEMMSKYGVATESDVASNRG